MTDRLYPLNKENGATANPAVAPTGNPHQFPSTTKTQLYNPMRHPNRPNPTASYSHDGRRFNFRRCLCFTCLWSILVLIGILLISTIILAAFYVIYQPHRPVFYVTSVKLSEFNLTTTPSDGTTRLTTQFNLTLSTKNSNSKVIFYYDPLSITLFSSNQVTVSSCSFTNFTNLPNSMFVIHATTVLNHQLLDGEETNSLKSDLKKKNGIPMQIAVDTMAGVKMEKLKLKKIGIRVMCDGIRGAVQKGENSTSADISNANCKVDLRIKILKWTF